MIKFKYKTIIIEGEDVLYERKNKEKYCGFYLILLLVFQATLLLLFQLEKKVCQKI